jgi:hypothetical protein
MRIDFFGHLLYAKSEKEERAEIDSFADQIHFGCNSAVGDITLKNKRKGRGRQAAPFSMSFRIS